MWCNRIKKLLFYGKNTCRICQQNTWYTDTAWKSIPYDIMSKIYLQQIGVFKGSHFIVKNPISMVISHTLLTVNSSLSLLICSHDSNIYLYMIDTQNHISNLGLSLHLPIPLRLAHIQPYSTTTVHQRTKKLETWDILLPHFPLK